MPQQQMSLGDWLEHGKMPYGDIWRGMGNVIPGLVKTAQAAPQTLATLAELQTGQRQAPAGPARGMQWLLQQANPVGGTQGRVGLHPSDFTGMPGAVVNYYNRKYGTWGGLGRNARDDPVGTGADLSLAAAAPEDAAKAAATIAGRVGAPEAVQGALAAARGATRPLAKAATAINPATPFVAAGSTALRAAKGTLGAFDHTGAFTPKGLTQLKQAGNAAFPNGEITAAEYADPRFQAHMAPIVQSKGFRPQAFKEGVLSYSGAPTPSGPITRMTPRHAAVQATNDLINQGHQAIDARVKGIAIPPKEMGTPTADQIRTFANGPGPAKAGLSGADTTDLRLAAAGKDVLDSSMATPPPSLLSKVGPPLGKLAWETGTTLGGLALGAAAGHSSPLLSGLGELLPEAVGAVGGYAFGHKAGAPGALSQAASGLADWSAIRRAGAGAPTDVLDVPSWTGKAIERAAPAAISLGGGMDPGQPPPAAAPPGQEAPPPGGWQAPAAFVPRDLDQEDVAPSAATEASPAPPRHNGQGPEHDQIAPPDIQKMMPPAYTPPADLDAQAAPQADGGRVGFAVGGQVADMTEHLIRRAGQAQKAAQASTRPLLGLSDTTVARALAVAQRGL